jgi:two-component system, OmpR family, response regulator
MDSRMEQPVVVAQEHIETWIVLMGEVSEIRSALSSAIRDEGWQWQEFPTMDAFLAAPRPPRTVVIPVIETFTIASLELIRNLATLLGLPVVVFGMEHHPMMVRAALEAGADDVITIPSSIEEILVRLRAIVRVAFPRDDGRSEHGAYHLDDSTRSVSIEGGPAIGLTLGEYRILKTLLATPDQPVSRADLIAQICPFTRSRGTGTLDVTIGRLRRKLGAQRVRTIRGVGYQLIDEYRQTVQTG